jgi:hypothetical protein
MPDHPSTDTTMTMLVGDGRTPFVEASASIIRGSESMFARVEVDTGLHGPERHACHFVLIGRRADVLGVLNQLRVAVVNAPVPIAGGQDDPPLLTRPHDWPEGAEPDRSAEFERDRRRRLEGGEPQ